MGEAQRSSKRGEKKDRARRESKDSERRDRDRSRDGEAEREIDRESGREHSRVKEEGQDGGEDKRPKESSRDIEERIARMKESRIKDKTKPKDEDDVLSWVNKSRKLQKVKKTTPACKSIAAQEEEGTDEEDDESGYSAKELAGLKIRHGLDKLIEGGEVVLTLKDTRIIAGDDLNEDADELENVNLAEQKVREDAYKASKKKPAIYEDKFQNDINTVKSILPQYDDLVKDEGFQLDESGGINEDSQKKLEQVRQRLQDAAVKVESLLGPGGKASDYYTQEEMLKFKKPKKQKKIRKKDLLDVDALEAEAKAAGLGAEDLGSRNNNQRVKQESDADANSRRQTYDSAFAKALEASKALREDKMEVDTFIADEDDEMYSGLRKSRELAIKKRTESTVGPQGIAARLREMEEKRMKDGEGEALAEKAVVITETEEFCLSLQPDEAISRRTAGHDSFGDEEDSQSGRTPMETQEAHGEIETKASDNEDEKDDNIDDELPIKEVSVGKGLAGALKLLQERGSLKETVEWGGRNMDKKPSKLIGVVDNEPPEREIHLDRRDEYGRTMTPKEAFRQLSHKFHGKGPGKTKQEKKMKQHEEELKQKQMPAGDTPFKSMEKMREAQLKTNSPYIVMSGHIKPGQTSDPRSGFATVEKEPIGSLTPMLGDKKVEHFLGIKRPPGDMGPPLPKKKPKI